MKRLRIFATLIGFALVLIATSRLGKQSQGVAAGTAAPATPHTQEAGPLRPTSLEMGSVFAGESRRPHSSALFEWSGMVLDRLERPVPGATVQLVDRAGHVEIKRSTTSDEGEFTIASPASGGMLRITAHGFLQTDRVLDGLPINNPLRFILTASRSIHGVVTASGDLNGTVEIRTLEASPAIPCHSWTLQGVGPFTVGNAPVGKLDCIALAQGFTPIHFRVPENPSAKVSIELRKGSRAELEVHVHGEPFESIRVDMARSSILGAPARTVAFAKGPSAGSLVFPDLFEGRFEVTVTSKRTRGWQQRALVDAIAGQRARLEFHFEALSGRLGRLVEDRSSNPVAGIEVSVRDPRGGIEATCISQEDGTLRLPPCGSHADLEATCITEGWVLVEGARWGTLEIASDAGTEPLVLRVRPARRIGGLVTRAGQPELGRVRVQVFRGVPRQGSALSAVITHDGQFELNAPVSAVGRHAILARADDAQGVLAHDFADPSDDLPDLELDPHGEVFGSVRCEEGTVAELANVRIVRVEPVSGHPLGWGDHAAPLDAQGTFRLGDVPAGAYRIELARTHFTPIPVEVLPGASVGPLELLLDAPAGERLEGWVAYADGTPATGARVSAVAISKSSTSGEFRATRADSEGRFALEVDHTGLFELRAMVIPSLGQVPARSSAPLVLPAGSTDAQLVLHRPPTATVSGQLVDLGEQEVTMRATNGSDSAMQRLGNGWFEVEGVPTGHCQLEFSAFGKATTTREVELATGEHFDLGDLYLADLRPVHVRVFDANSVPLAGAEVFSLPDQEPLSVPPPREYALGRTDASGSLRVAALGPKPLRLVAWSPGFVPTQAEVEPFEDSAERTLVLQRSVSLRVEGLQQALADALFWSATLSREGDPTVVRRRGVNRKVLWTEFNDLAPGRYSLELRPTVATHVPGWHVDLDLEHGGDTVILIHLDGQRFGPTGEPR